MKFTLFSVAVLLLSLVIINSSPEGAAAFSFFGAHKKVKSVDGSIKIPLAQVSDGKAHHFQYVTDISTIKFFVLKSKDGVIRAAFDACDVCFPAKKGYTQDGEFMICNNCGRRFHASRINVVEGGCNPAPLKRQVVDQHLVIAVKDVIPGSRFF